METAVAPIKLIAKHGRLFVSLLDHLKGHNPKDYEMYSQAVTGDMVLLMRGYDAGDCDTIHWPNPNEENLRAALFDAREQGFIPDLPTVILPDGTEFTIESLA